MTISIVHVNCTESEIYYIPQGSKAAAPLQHFEHVVLIRQPLFCDSVKYTLDYGCRINPQRTKRLYIFLFLQMKNVVKNANGTIYIPLLMN